MASVIMALTARHVLTSCSTAENDEIRDRRSD